MGTVLGQETKTLRREKKIGKAKSVHFKQNTGLHFRKIVIKATREKPREKRKKKARSGNRGQGKMTDIGPQRRCDD